MRSLIHLACVVAALCGAIACGHSSSKDDAAPSPDDAGATIDSGVSAIDAAPGTPDSGPTAAAPPVKEIVPAAGRMSGGGFTLDVEVGHSVEQTEATGGGYTVEGGAAIKQ